MLSALLLIGNCFAVEADILKEQIRSMGLDEFEKAAEGYLGEVDLQEGADLEGELGRLMEEGKRQFPAVLRRAVKSSAALLAIVLLCSLAQGAMEGAGNGQMSVVTLVGALAVTGVAVSDIRSLIGMGTRAIGQMETLSKVFLPAITVTAVAAGTPASAAARQLATMLFSDVLLTLIDRLLLPLVYAYIAACTANAALGNNGVKRMAELIKWVITSTLTVLLLLFVSYLTVSGAIAGGSDAMAVKAAKFAVSGMVPVVGGILSDAAETVLAGAGILKNSVGIVGMLAVLTICMAPFLQLGIHYLAYKLTAALAVTVSEDSVSGLVSLIGGAFGLVLGMTGACAVLLLISIVSAVTVVVR